VSAHFTIERQTIVWPVLRLEVEVSGVWTLRPILAVTVTSFSNTLIPIPSSHTAFLSVSTFC
jgi:hypothetical protein